MSTCSNNAICQFKDDAPIWNFLHRKFPHLISLDTKQYKFIEIQSTLSQVIKDKKLFDAANPAIVLCDKDLEDALNVRSFHVSQFSYYITKQFQFIKCEPPTDPRSNLEAASSTDSLSTESNHVPCEYSHKNSSQSNLRRQPSVDYKVEGTFIISKELRDTFKLLDNFKSEQSLFEYSEVLSYLSKYIIKKKDTFFDPRNVKIANIEGDLLERAFKVKAFHRSQVTALLDREINRVPIIDEVKIEDLTTKEECNIQENDGDYSKSSSCHFVEDEDQNDHKRKFSIEYEKSEEQPGCSSSSSPPKRVRRLSTYTVSILGYDSTDEETIYSAQGYETVAMSEGSHHSKSCDNENMHSSGSSNEDEMVYSVEYEINDDDDEEDNEEDRRRKNNENSDEDSELDDVVLMATVLDLMEEEKEFWADSESDIDDEFEIKDTKSVYKCCKCGEQNKVILSYCDSCWQERKETFPKREKPRKKRRHVIRNTLASDELIMMRNGGAAPTQSDTGEEFRTKNKEVIPSYLRSYSQPCSSATSSKMSNHYESQDSGLGSQDSICSEKSRDDSSEENDFEGIYTPFKSYNPTKSSLASNNDKTQNESFSGCTFCFRRPKNATLIHGNIGHTVCCYPCAKKLWKNQRPCPICRRKIEKFVLNIEA
ncbi:E3 ubiquitin-protein ligase Mdm2 isoform X2 [Lepeophtheirus salmonis]|nr:E3 ubiquitin-protein ligase Mdm2-like isoform X2 [Lepeophtheirus salmonis]XP_040564097.1 E3 ubiquitin-protein ligase Mdm2-like isoform X2 [Lepeophtheirus salmonis]